MMGLPALFVLLANMLFLEPLRVQVALGVPTLRPQAKARASLAHLAIIVQQLD
jgi:hypothetical protein